MLPHKLQFRTKIVDVLPNSSRHRVTSCRQVVVEAEVRGWVWCGEPIASSHEDDVMYCHLSTDCASKSGTEVEALLNVPPAELGRLNCWHRRGYKLLNALFSRANGPHVRTFMVHMIG